MRQKRPAENVAQRLEEAVERVGNDDQKARILAAALCGFAKPVPEYEVLRQHLLRPCERDVRKAARGNPRFRPGFSGEV